MMHYCTLSRASLPLLLISTFLCGLTTSAPLVTESSNAVTAMQQLQSSYKSTILDSLPAGTCTRDNIVVRKSWYCHIFPSSSVFFSLFVGPRRDQTNNGRSALSASQRIAYITAVNCLVSKPALTSLNFAPGARNRRDDFTVAHINETVFIHLSVSNHSSRYWLRSFVPDSYLAFQGFFLPWHRYYVWAYEKALREECGYTGYQPYWDWPEYANNQQASPVFDNSSTSFGGNGKYIPHSALNLTVPGLPVPFSFPRAAGTGGGCIQSGPFANLTITLGPVSQNVAPGDTNGLGYNPRCLARDFLESQSSYQLSYKNVTDLIALDSIHTFHPAMEGQFGVHSGGHGFVGGDMQDIFSSPNDPAFFLHHAMVDRVWAIWQSIDPATRTYALDGTMTYLNGKPSFPLSKINFC